MYMIKKVEEGNYICLSFVFNKKESGCCWADVCLYEKFCLCKILCKI